MVLFNIPAPGVDQPTIRNPEEALRYVDWRAHKLPYCGVYLIAEGSDGPVKIGVSVCAAKRLADLQCGCPRRLHIFDYAWVTSIHSAKAIEREAHDILKANDLGVHGEWFAVTVEKAFEAIQWSALSLGLELHTEIPDDRDIQFKCMRLSGAYMRDVEGVTIPIYEATQEEIEDSRRRRADEWQENERRILKQKLGISG